MSTAPPLAVNTDRDRKPRVNPDAETEASPVLKPLCSKAAFHTELTDRPLMPLPPSKGDGSQIPASQRHIAVSPTSRFGSLQ